MSDHDDEGTISRRGALRIGGLTVAMAAVVAACSNTEAGEVGRVGLAPSTTALPKPDVTDIALLRTCSAIQYNLIDVYTVVQGKPELVDPVHQPLFDRMLADAQATAKIFEDLTVELGGEVWACRDTKFAEAFTDPALDRVLTGADATAEAEAIPPSDDKRRDVLNLVQGMESIVAATYQQYTGMFNDPALREPTITCGVRGARHSALLALTSNPGGYVAPSAQAAAEVSTDTLPGGSTTSTVAQNIGNTTTTAAAPSDGGPTMTVIPDNFALTSTFGSTSAITVVLGAGDVNGTRLKVLLETPSLNSIEYEFLGACQ